MNVFSTMDVYTAAYLEISGFEITFKENHAGRVVFSIGLTEEARAALEEYNTGFVQAKPFANKIKDIKKRMYLTKDHGGEGLEQNGNSH